MLGDAVADPGNSDSHHLDFLAGEVTETTFLNLLLDGLSVGTISDADNLYGYPGHPSGLVS